MTGVPIDLVNHGVGLVLEFEGWNNPVIGLHKYFILFKKIFH